ncbi:MAG: OmpP1/FadL family transporter [Myxococcaceae bacterium]
MQPLVFALVALLSSASFGSLLNPLDPYGVHSRDMGTARARSPFSPCFAATLSNPSALAQSAPSEVTLGYLYARPTLSMDGQGVASATNNMPLVGLRLNLSSMTSLNRDIGFGMAIGLDDNLRGLLTLSDGPSNTGQFVREGRRQLMLGAGLGVEIIPKLRVGAGVLLAIAATAQLNLQTTLNGQTSNESMNMEVGPRFSPVLGAVIGPWDTEAVRGISFALSYRTASWQGVRVDANAQAQLGGSPLTTLPLQLTFVDAYRPEDFTLGFQFVVGRVTANVALDYARWSQLGRVLDAEDTVRGNLGISFSDILSPRLGAEVAIPYNLAARAGYAFEASPLRDAPPNTLNLVDNSRHIISVGLGYTLPANTSLLRQPLSIDAAYQLHALASRSVTLQAADGNQLATRSGGVVHAANLSLTLRF